MVGQLEGVRDPLLPSSALPLVTVDVSDGGATQQPTQQIRPLLGPGMGDSAAPRTDGWAPIPELCGARAIGLVPLDMAPQGDQESPSTDMTTYKGEACTSVHQAIVVSRPVLSEEKHAIVMAKEMVALGNIKSFCAGLLKKLAPPLLKEIEGARGVWPGQDPFTPGRTTRSVVSSLGGGRKTKATVAETVLLRTLGIAYDELEVSDDTLGLLRSMFDSPCKNNS
ncbi:hypothetical protein D1007_60583 [Hordeum vulgare]|nr:hypothetical protein D1007_60583 [Hordeum vulgare]